MANVFHIVFLSSEKVSTNNNWFFMLGNIIAVVNWSLPNQHKEMHCSTPILVHSSTQQREEKSFIRHSASYRTNNISNTTVINISHLLLETGRVIKWHRDVMFMDPDHSETYTQVKQSANTMIYYKSKEILLTLWQQHFMLEKFTGQCHFKLNLTFCSVSGNLSFTDLTCHVLQNISLRLFF